MRKSQEVFLNVGRNFARNRLKKIREDLQKQSRSNFKRNPWETSRRKFGRSIGELPEGTLVALQDPANPLRRCEELFKHPPDFIPEFLTKILPAFLLEESSQSFSLGI